MSEQFETGAGEGIGLPGYEPAGLEGAPSVDDLAERKLDHEGDTKATDELLVPVGTYDTKSATVREHTFERDGEKRIMQFVAAEIILAKDTSIGKGDTKKVLAAGSYEDSIEFSFSHQRRDNPETGEPDGNFKRYLKVKAAYKAVMDAEPGTVDDLKEFIEKYPLRLRITRFDGRNFVVEIRPIKS